MAAVFEITAFLDYVRGRTNSFLDTIAKNEKAQEILGWRPAPGRAHIAWQLMHIAATDDRHVHVRMTGGQPQHEDYVRRFAGGSTPDEAVPTVDEIRTYLAKQRDELKQHLLSLPADMLDKKPNEQAPWAYREWVMLLSWHEAHHQGQAHAVMNLWKSAHGEK